MAPPRNRGKTVLYVFANTRVFSNPPLRSTVDLEVMGDILRELAGNGDLAKRSHCLEFFFGIPLTGRLFLKRGGTLPELSCAGRVLCCCTFYGM
jgi:hypothetical protein